MSQGKKTQSDGTEKMVSKRRLTGTSKPKIKATPNEMIGTIPLIKQNHYVSNFLGFVEGNDEDVERRRRCGTWPGHTSYQVGFGNEVERNEEVKQTQPTDPLLIQHQLSHQTKTNRFPKIFKSVVGFQPNPTRILSFGCSTGEECFTLADLYPKAEIIGVDLDRWSIEKAKTKNKFKERVGFMENLDEAGKFDIIFCLMVLFSIYSPVSFKDFSDTIERLSSHLNYGGLLVMYTGQHDVMATTSRDKYSAIRTWTRQHSSDKRSYFNGYFKKIK